MNHLNLGELSACISAISSLEMGCLALAVSPQPNLNNALADVTAKSIDAVSRAINECGSAQLQDAAATLARIHIHISNASFPPKAAALEAELRHAKESMISELARKQLLYIGEDRSGLLEQEQLFGALVYDAYPSARRDITEAGNCLASECNTAAVFHLMRAAEIALRALALDRSVSYPNSSVDEQQCGTLITSLDSKVKALREADKKLWPSESIKNAQIKFYHAALAELRSFNEAWRKHVAHAGADAFYDRHQAFSIFGHVSTFMQMLSVRISESKVTPEFWTS